jgi:hypothetical protein
VSPEQAEVITRSIDALPSGEAVRTRGEAALLDHAGSFDATDLARMGRHLAHVVDPDGADRRLERELDRDERASHLTRYLSIAADGAGGVRLQGRGTAEDGALLKAALMPLTTPAPAVAVDDGTGSGCMTHVMPGPGCGTPSSPPPNTHSTPTWPRSPTVPAPGSWSPPPSRR